MKVRSIVFAVLVCLLAATTAAAQSTVVPGHQKQDRDGNGIPDSGTTVQRWNALYAYDGTGAWYWDLGDGRVYGTVADPSLLNASTLTTCAYVNVSRGAFENDAFQDSGWIMNNIRCSGYDGHATFHYLIVHDSDPRYSGDPAWEAWPAWQYAVLTVSGSGNLVRR